MLGAPYKPVVGLCGEVDFGVAVPIWELLKTVILQIEEFTRDCGFAVDAIPSIERTQIATASESPYIPEMSTL